MREDELVPYEVTDLTAGRVLVLAAHPDDEVLGAGGLIALCAGLGSAVRIWIATDGTAQQGAEAEDTPAYAERRREESRRAARALGVDAPVFAGLSDRSLASRADELSRLVAAEISAFEPDLVLCPSPVEIHPDHRALAETLFRTVAASRPGDADHDRYRFLRIAFCEISQPLLPNALVDIAGVMPKKQEALAAYESQQAVRDYAGALLGLNVYRRLTVSGTGPVEAFSVLSWQEASSRSLEELRRAIGPAVIRDGARGPAPLSVVVRTRNRPALLTQALESLRAQTARPAEVVVVNDGGASVCSVIEPFRDAFAVSLEEFPERRGRSVAANRGVESSGQDLVAFLDDDDLCFPDHVERLVSAHRSGPEPVVYSDAVTVVYRREGEEWKPGTRTLQYSLDFDPDYLLLANYIPLHTLLLPRALFRKLGGFDDSLDYSEDWDFLIRASFETSFRHVRAVTCEYRVFPASDADPSHAAAGSAAFQQARREIYRRYAPRRTEEGLSRAFDRMRAQIAFWYERDSTTQGELRYQRESHRRLADALARAEARTGMAAALEAKLAESELRVAQLQSERSRLLAENELIHDRLAELFAKNEEFDLQLVGTFGEIERLNGILNQIYGSRTWKLHLFLDRLRGRG
ncbi:MAG TPA: PIG-L family deacetylase [Thermoanaerobaculia bacterium]|nr:PIG-L family deacetylase [Thermoanaerobaculia bacterium]